MIIAREFRFEAAHFLPGHPKCGRMHGHSYRLVVAVEGPVGENGMVMDFSQLKDIVQSAILNRVDHRPLNDVPGIRKPPTVENLLLTLDRSSLEVSGRLWFRATVAPPRASRDRRQLRRMVS